MAAQGGGIAQPISGERRNGRQPLLLLTCPPLIILSRVVDPPPMKWSDSKYGFLPEEDRYAEEKTQGGRDRAASAF